MPDPARRARTEIPRVVRVSISGIMGDDNVFTGPNKRSARAVGCNGYPIFRTNRGVKGAFATVSRFAPLAFLSFRDEDEAGRPGMTRRHLAVSAVLLAFDHVKCAPRGFGQEQGEQQTQYGADDAEHHGRE